MLKFIKSNKKVSSKQDILDFFNPSNDMDTLSIYPISDLSYEDKVINPFWNELKCGSPADTPLCFLCIKTSLQLRESLKNKIEEGFTQEFYLIDKIIRTLFKGVSTLYREVYYFDYLQQGNIYINKEDFEEVHENLPVAINFSNTDIDTEDNQIIVISLPKEISGNSYWKSISEDKDFEDKIINLIKEAFN